MFMKDTALVQLDQVSMHFFHKEGILPVLKDVSLRLMPGEIAAILGPSGCGKSTVLNILSGLLVPTGGTVRCTGNIGYMFQRDHLLDWRTIYDNVMIGLEVQKKKQGTDDLNEQIARVETLLLTYGLWEFRNRYPAELSGGMRQRAALIRTLAISPDVLLLDEPSMGLSPLYVNTTLFGRKEKLRFWYLMISGKPSVLRIPSMCLPDVLLKCAVFIGCN